MKKKKTSKAPGQLWQAGGERGWECICDCSRSKINKYNSSAMPRLQEEGRSIYAKEKKDRKSSVNNVQNKRDSKFLKCWFLPVYLPCHPFTHSCRRCQLKTNSQRRPSPSPPSSVQPTEVITLVWRNRQFSCRQEGIENSIQFQQHSLELLICVSDSGNIGYKNRERYSSTPLWNLESSRVFIGSFNSFGKHTMKEGLKEML